MKPYYQDNYVTQYCNDALTVLTELESDTVDLLATDPPYGISFMGKEWDKALPDKKIWQECLRVLKPGAFAFVMSIPRSDCLSRMIISLEDAGFRVDFSPIYWAYASGFPKAQNIAKYIDKKLGTENIIGKGKAGKTALGQSSEWNKTNNPHEFNITEPTSPQAKALDGSYGGFQPKPAVEVIIVAMKPMSEKTFVDQALKNGKGITWLDDCRVSTEHKKERITNQNETIYGGNSLLQSKTIQTTSRDGSTSGRFPANLIVSDDVLNDGRVRKSGYGDKRSKGKTYEGWGFTSELSNGENNTGGDSGSFSRYFDLDSWAQKTFPFLIVPKASKSEKNKGCEDLFWWDGEQIPRELYEVISKVNESLPLKEQHKIARGNIHSTVKPLKLMSYLVTLGSRPGDVVLDPFGGSGTTALASKLLGRYCIISEIEEKYCEISAKRLSQSVMRLEV